MLERALSAAEARACCELSTSWVEDDVDVDDMPVEEGLSSMRKERLRDAMSPEALSVGGRCSNSKSSDRSMEDEVSIDISARRSEDDEEDEDVVEKEEEDDEDDEDDEGRSVLAPSAVEAPFPPRRRLVPVLVGVVRASEASISECFDSGPNEEEEDEEDGEEDAPVVADVVEGDI